MEKLVAIIFSLLILFSAWCYSRFAKSWLIPGVVFSVFWFLYTFLPLVFLPEVPINYEAIAYVFFFCQAIMLSSILFNWDKAERLFKSNNAYCSEMEYFDSRFLKLSFFLIQFFVLFTIFFDVINQGFSIRDIFFNLMSTSSSYIALRYSGSLQESIVTRFGTVFTYVGVMLGGFVFCFSKSTFKKMVIVAISLLPSVLLMVVQGAKGALFLCMSLFYGSIIVYRFYNGDTALTNSKTNKVLLYSIFLLIPAIVSSFLSRGLYDQDLDYIFQKLKMYLMSYAFAHLYAFSDWFGGYIGNQSLMQFDDLHNESEYGFYTFMAIFRALGSERYVPPGVFDEYYAYQEVIKSNIYTMYRGVILDFGIFGSLIFSFLLGFILNFSYYLICVLKRPLFFISIYIAMFGFYYTSFIISIFIWNSLFVSLFFFYAFLFLNRYFFHSKNRLAYV